MASRIKTLRPLISTMAPRLGGTYELGNEQARTRYRDQNQPWRAWYKTKRWEDLRLEVFVRDLYRCQRSGVLCVGKHPAPNSPVANHIQPHHGDPDLFWDPNNIETVSKEVHDGLIQSEERRGQAW